MKVIYWSAVILDADWTILPELVSIVFETCLFEYECFL